MGRGGKPLHRDDEAPTGAAGLCAIKGGLYREMHQGFTFFSLILHRAWGGSSSKSLSPKPLWDLQAALLALGSLPFPLSPAEEGGQEDEALQQPKSLSHLYMVLQGKGTGGKYHGYGLAGKEIISTALGRSLSLFVILYLPSFL